MYRLTTRTRAGTATAVAILILVVVGVMLPAFASRSMIQDLFFILTMLTLAQLWNLLAGYGGLVSVGQQAFVGIGAYAMFAGVILLGWDPVWAIPLGGLAAFLLAVPTAFFAFRLQGAYFAIGTWVIAEVTRLLVAQWKALGGGTGTSLPREATRNIIGTDAIQALFGVRDAAARDILAYWLALVLVVLATAGIYWLLRSRLGLALAAVRDNVDAAQSVGVDAGKLKWAVFLIAAAATGLTGALIFMQTARISPDAAFAVTDWTAYVIFIVVIGGIGTIEGPILGVLVFYMLRSVLADYGSWYLMTLGVLAIVIMLFAPTGLWGLISTRSGLHLFPVRRRLTGAKIEGEN
ncbi:MAG: branched-chain amino acid ABC transporter permease [Alphaproteobacteria bacterium]|nr:branched-chain amino acid ABC transporter permease [Alphaproteobacteria bacterium]MBU0804242.1 branched-chain amino acid ABC transporter permease [Alphaproteobacteria bacterium]MBU0871073.1 branched-chain amino acid ABC transporter permease [Alphaproteobacteria bacterium]MBU1400828.1 branched-chain amino acid ABC transporter permease [Alphaproteobacteria bacterium]MBU1592755.1 branched-chain amino acid ABC transporter permease [Alphaproteobacteria bacterium]